MTKPLLIVLALLLVAWYFLTDHAEQVKIVHTPQRDTYGYLGSDGPLVVVLAYGIRQSLASQTTDLTARLSSAGYRIVSVDLPCHGEEKGALDCWAKRAKSGDGFPAFTAKLQRVIADVRKRGLATGDRVTVVGISRGGYAAMRAATLPEVTDIVALLPVTDLTRLSEFKGMTLGPEFALDPALVARKRLYVEIGTEDSRVDTKAQMRFFAAVIGAGGTRLTAKVRPGGHVLGPQDEAAEWVLKRLP